MKCCGRVLKRLYQLFDCAGRALPVKARKIFMISVKSHFIVLRSVLHQVDDVVTETIDGRV